MVERRSLDFKGSDSDLKLISTVIVGEYSISICKLPAVASKSVVLLNNIELQLFFNLAPVDIIADSARSIHIHHLSPSREFGAKTRSPKSPSSLFLQVCTRDSRSYR